MPAGCTKNTHRRKPRFSCCLGRGFAQNLPPQVSGYQKREDKFDSYCLFHVALDVTLFKMFPFNTRMLKRLKRWPNADIFSRDRTFAGVAGRASRSNSTLRTPRGIACRSWVRRWIFSLRNGATVPEEKFPRH